MTIPAAGRAVKFRYFVFAFFCALEGAEMKETFPPKGRLSGPIMPNWILKNRSVSLGAKVLYSVLANCAADGSDHCFPSQAWLSENMGVSLRSIQNWLRELADLGFISVEPGKAGRVCRYYFLARPEAALAPRRNAEGYVNHAQGYANRAYRSKLIDKYNTPPLPPSPSRHMAAPPRQDEVGDSFSSALESCLKGFEQVWTLWPVKQAERQALALWKRLWFDGRLPSLETLLAKVREFQSADRRWRRGYAPLLLNWLRGERWNDVPLLQEESGETPTREAPNGPEEKAKNEALAAFAAELKERSRREHIAHLAGRPRNPEVERMIAKARAATMANPKQGIVHATQ